MNKRKYQIIAILMFVIVGSALFFYKKTKITQAESKKSLSKEKSVKILEQQEVGKDFIKKRGIIKGGKEVYLSAKASGRISKIYKKIGDKVYKGQLLATIDGSELVAQNNVAQVGFDFSNKIISKTKDYYKKQVSQARQAEDLAKEAYYGIKNGDDQEAIATAKANYEMTKKSVAIAKKGYNLQVDVSRGKRDIAQSQLIASNVMTNNINLRAPFDGIVVQKMVEVGDLVSPERPVLLLVNNDLKEINISITKQLLNSIVVGQSVEVISDNGKKVEAKVKAVSPMIDTHTRKALVTIILPKNSDFILGEYVDVLFSQPSDNDKIMVPQSALVKIYHDYFVFVDDNGFAKKIKVEIGDMLGDQVVINSGIKKESKIIIEGQQYLNNGDKIKIAK